MGKMKDKHIEILNQEKKLDASSELQNTWNKLSKALDEGFTGLILNVYPTDSNTYFKNSNFDNRIGYCVEIKLNSENGEIFTQFFSIPELRGIQKSNLYAFEKKYKSIPIKGLEVEVCLNENGFFEIVF
jgi:hypothetical protein